MPRVFLSPSSQIHNRVHGGGNEQQYARARCERAAEILRSHGVEVRVSPVVDDDRNGYLRSVRDGNTYRPDIYVADHTNAANGYARGWQGYIWPDDPNSRRLAQSIGSRVAPLLGSGATVLDGSAYAEVNGPTATAVLLEQGFHDNPQDAAVIRARTREMGEAMAHGILHYFGIPIRQQSAPAPATPDPKPEPTIEELIAMNSGVFCIDGKIYRYLVFNTHSGWEHEYNNGTSGALGGEYNNPFAATLRTGSFAKVSPSHFRAIKSSLADLRAGKVEVSGTVTIEGEQA